MKVVKNIISKMVGLFILFGLLSPIISYSQLPNGTNKDNLYYYSNIDTNIIIEFTTKHTVFTSKSDSLVTVMSSESYDFMGKVKNHSTNELLRVIFENYQKGYNMGHDFYKEPIQFYFSFDSSRIDIIQLNTSRKDSISKEMDTTLVACISLFLEKKEIIMVMTQERSKDKFEPAKNFHRFICDLNDKQNYINANRSRQSGK